MHTDTHNHTIEFSPDAKMTIDDLVSSALVRNIGRIGITEHYEIDNPDPGDNIRTFDLQAYDRAFKQWTAKYEGKIELLKGIEFGYQTTTAEKIDKTVDENDFDIVLLSNHLFGNRDVYFSSTVYKTERKERHRTYIGKMAEMADRCRDYDVIAHFDYVNRYNPVKDETVFYDDCPGEFDALFETIISREKALEINTRSIEAQIRKSSSHIMPDRKIIERYIEMGGKLISLGSDSHSPETIGIHFGNTAEYLKSLGINEVCYFKGRKLFTEEI